MNADPKELVERLRAWPATGGADGMSAGFVSGLLAEASSLIESQAAQAMENGSAYQAAQATLATLTRQLLALAMALHKKHFAVDSPHWQPLEDAEGLLSQVDNMTTALAAEAAIASLREEIGKRVAAEREACAKLCDHRRKKDATFEGGRNSYALFSSLAARDLAAAIRARSLSNEETK